MLPTCGISCSRAISVIVLRSNQSHSLNRLREDQCLVERGLGNTQGFSYIQTEKAASNANYHHPSHPRAQIACTIRAVISIGGRTLSGLRCRDQTSSLIPNSRSSAFSMEAECIGASVP